MIERSIVHYLANHDRRREQDTPPPVWPGPAQDSGFIDVGVVQAGLPPADEAEFVPDMSPDAFSGADEDLAGALASPTDEPAGPDAASDLPGEDQDRQAMIAAHIGQARQDWVQAESEVLSRQFADALAALETRIANEVAAILAPLADAAVRQRALDGLARRIRTLLAGQSGKLLHISGPRDLLEAIHARAGDEVGAIVFEAAEANEVRVVAGALVIELSLKDWEAELKAIMQEAAP